MFGINLDEIKEKTKEYNEFKKDEHVWKADLIIERENGDIKTVPNCFVKGWIVSLYVWLNHTTFFTNDIDGVSREMEGNPFGGSGVVTIKRAKNDVRRGLIVGTGTTAVDVDDHYLDTIIGTGTATGELVYEATNVTSIKANSGSIEYNIDRSFFNDSGATITIKEIGLLIDNEIVPSGATQFLVDRTLATIVVLDNEHVRLRYQIRQTSS